MNDTTTSGSVPSEPPPPAQTRGMQNVSRRTSSSVRTADPGWYFMRSHKRKDTSVVLDSALSSPTLTSETALVKLRCFAVYSPHTSQHGGPALQTLKTSQAYSSGVEQPRASSHQESALFIHVTMGFLCLVVLALRASRITHSATVSDAVRRNGRRLEFPADLP